MLSKICRRNFRFSTALRTIVTKTDDNILTASDLSDMDPEVTGIIGHELKRQRESLCLIPSENFTSKAVLQALGSVMSNKYSEGYPGARYYGGNEFIDQAENLCRQRALEAYGLNPQEWGVNVQSLSGSPANFAVYTALMQTHDRLIALDLPHGGHLSHGYQIPGKKISAVSKYFESFPYRLNEETGLVNYDEMEDLAIRYRPKVIVCGGSAYSRHWDTARIREISDKVGSIMLFDMAHISGLVAAGVHPSPFKHADIVTTTTHKSLRGPRGAMIFFRRGVKGTDKKGKQIKYDYENRINEAVFPGHQGGPHNHTITALAVALEQTKTAAFKEYQADVVENMKALAKELEACGFDLVSGGTDNHLALIDLRNKKVKGAQVELVMELANIACNKNTVPGDKSALIPSGIRIGTPAMTTRGLKPEHMKVIAGFLDRATNIAIDLSGKVNSAKFKDFKEYLSNSDVSEITKLKQDVIDFTSQLPFPVDY